MSVPKGWIAPRRNVPCSGGCGATLSRTSHFDTAVCHTCDRKRHNAAKAPVQRRMREEARRYRIALAVGPYKTWPELYAALRIRSPKTWSASYDLTTERRMSA